MSENKDNSVLDCVTKEVVRMAIERIQGERVNQVRVEEEPEVISPKACYDVEENLNIPYMNREEIPLAMDVFKPVVPEETELPVIVVIHGGGLVLGNRAISRRYAKALAHRGYLVFSMEYRLAPRANACEQLDDVCAGMDLVGQMLVDYNVDFTRMFLTAESAGAFLATYVASMKKSKKLQEAIGYEPTRMTFKALGLHGGMFYTDRDDPIGWVLSDQFFGEKKADEDFLQYLNPEHDEIIKNLPPTFLTTSRGDFLNRYTLMFHDALKKAGRKSHLVYYGEDYLGHAFVGLEPYLKESIDAIDKMCDWFEEQAKEALKEQEQRKIELQVLEEINSRLASGELIGCKSWRFIKDLNSFSEDQLNSVAMIDGKREYTYRQMFRKWDRYAEVFSALGITQKNGSRVGMAGNAAVEPITAFYALNMTGTSVSMLSNVDLNYIDDLRGVVKKEKITDLVLNDIVASPDFLKKVLEEKESLGIRNIIILSIPAGGKLVFEAEKARHIHNARALRRIPGIHFMEDLLVQYEAWPICYGSEESANAAVIVHTSGTTNGIHKPVPLSDEALNEAVARLVRDERFKKLRGRATTCSAIEMSMSYGMIDGVHLPLAFGGTIVTMSNTMPGPAILKAVTDYKINVIFLGGIINRALLDLPIHIDLSNLEFIFLGGNYISVEGRKVFNKFLKRHGSKAKAFVGYGLSEAGAACILASPDREDDAMGYPLSGVKVKIYDEDNNVFYNLEDGPRIGVLYLASRSLSSGYIDDRVFFTLDEIDGEKYYNTHDLVRVNDDGSLTYLGRGNQFFVNNEGVRFDAGLIERAISAEDGIEACGLVPEYNKGVHDTLPVLYVQTADKGREAYRTVKKALDNVFIKGNLFAETNLPSQCVIAEELPVNSSGKVDVHKIISEKTGGDKFKVSPVKKDGKLEDIRLINVNRLHLFVAMGMPEELEENNKKKREDFFKNGPGRMEGPPMLRV